MKTLIKISLIAALLKLFSCNKAKPINPIYNTDWAGIANVPTAQNVVLQFSGDDINVLLKDRLIEQMKFTVSNDTLNISKKMGGSPCPIDSKGVYQYVIKDDQLEINYVSDECDSRQYNMTVSNFKKVAVAN